MTQITLHIDGMMCGMCEAHVNDAVRKAIPVKKVNSSHSAGTCVILTEQDVDTDALKSAIERPMRKRGFSTVTDFLATPQGSNPPAVFFLSIS